MTKKIFLALLFLLICMSARVNFAQGYEPEELPYLAGDFNLSCAIMNQDRTVSSTTAVDGIKIIRISRDDKGAATDLYTLHFYIDRNLVLTKSGVSLPYEFKWNFKGLSQEVHELLFIINAPDNTIGVARLDLSIRH